MLLWMWLYVSMSSSPNLQLPVVLIFKVNIFCAWDRHLSQMSHDLQVWITWYRGIIWLSIIQLKSFCIIALCLVVVRSIIFSFVHVLTARARRLLCCRRMVCGEGKVGIGGATEIEMVTLFLSRLVERWHCCSSVKTKHTHQNSQFVHFVENSLYCVDWISLSHFCAGLWDWAEHFCAAPPDTVVGCKDETRYVAGAMEPDNELTACSLYPSSTPLKRERRYTKHVKGNLWWLFMVTTDVHNVISLLFFIYTCTFILGYRVLTCCECVKLCLVLVPNLQTFVWF